MPAEGLQFVKLSSDHKYEFNKEILKVLQTSEIKNRYVSVISVAGAFRTGKSFLLNFFLRYLHSKYVAKNVDDWLGKDDEPLEGFSWSYGDEANTTGIMMWSEIFLYDSPEGDKWAIILLDTQGTFDHDSSMNDCSIIFALSTIISSVQIYNITRQIKKTDFNYLELFVNYGRMASGQSAESQTKPFQHLIFLVRDWSWPGKKAYGIDGGEKHLSECLNNNKGGASNLRSYFENILCYLMPSPGRVVEEEEFNGCIGELEDAFKAHLQILIPKVLEPKNLVMKVLAGKRVRAGQLPDYIEIYMNVFSTSLPNMDDLKTANARAILANIVDSLRTKYSKRMEKELGEKGLSDPDFEIKHRFIKDSLFGKFDSKPKIDCKELSEEYRQKLSDDIQEKCDMLKQLNDLYRDRYLSNVVEAYMKSYNDAMKNAYIKYCITEQMLLAVHDNLMNKILSDFNKLESFVSKDLINKYLPKVEDIFNGYAAHKQFNEQRINDAKKLLRDKSEKYYSQHKKNLDDFRKKVKAEAGENFKDQFKVEHEKEKQKALKKFKAEAKNFPQELCDLQVVVLESDLDQLYELFSKPTLLELMAKARIDYESHMKSPPAVTDLKELEKRHLEIKSKILKECAGNEEYRNEIYAIIIAKYDIFESELKMKIETAKSELIMECKSALSKYTKKISSCKSEEELTEKHNLFKQDYLSELFNKHGTFLSNELIKREWRNAEKEIDGCYEKCKELLNSKIHMEYPNILEIIYMSLGTIVTEIYNNIVVFAETIVNGIVGTGKVVISAIAEGATAVGEAVVSVAGAAVDWFKNLSN